MKVLINVLIAVVCVATVLWVIFAIAYDSKDPLHEKSGISVILMETHIRSHPSEPEIPQHEEGDFIFRTPPRRPMHAQKQPADSEPDRTPSPNPVRLRTEPIPWIPPRQLRPDMPLSFRGPNLGPEIIFCGP